MIIGKKAFEFTIELCCQRFVVRHNERRFSCLLDHFCHRIGFAASCDTQEGLVLIAFEDRIADGFDRFGLISGGLVGAGYRKIWHCYKLHLDENEENMLFFVKRFISHFIFNF